MNRLVKRMIPVIFTLIAVGCLDPYAPPVSGPEAGYLVVDGFLNSGNKSVNVKLSRAQALTEPDAFQAVANASVTLEGDDGAIIAVPQNAPGVYEANAINISTGKKYQLRIHVEGKEYLSKLMELKKSPVLDSVTFRTKKDGVTVYVDSHDESGSTKYYQWVFTETWEYNADLFSAYIYDPRAGIVRTRSDDELVYICYQSETSTRVLITATTNNIQDVVNDFALTSIPKGSIKLRRKYSILVQQRALDEDAYNYWKNLQRTTENLGGLFDPLPGEVTGNVHNVNDPTEPVLGYFGGGEVQEKRLFIDYRDLPSDLQTFYVTPCEKETFTESQIAAWKGHELYIITANGSTQVVDYEVSTAVCADCRKRGGETQRPSYWPIR